MSNRITISVSGGEATFGSLVQTSGASDGTGAFEAALAAFERYIAAADRDPAVLRGHIERHAGALAETSRGSAAERSRFSDFLVTVKTDYAWLYPMLKDVVLGTAALAALLAP
jgi:hypothetical protein